MKILFLDHDGVMVTVTEFGTRADKKRAFMEEAAKKYNKELNVDFYVNLEYPPWIKFDDFNLGCVKSLNYIIEKTDCEIVISSDWRKFMPFGDLVDLYKHYGIKKEPFAVTPVFSDFVSKNTKRSFMFGLEMERKCEIEEYLNLNKHLDISNYCIVDDLELATVADAEHCVLTDDLYGISCEDNETWIRDNIIKILQS